MRAARAEPLTGAAGGNLQQRKHADHRDVLAFLHEAELDAQLGVAVAVVPSADLGRIVGHRRDDVQLHVGQGPVVDLDVRPVAHPAVPRLEVDGSHVEFPMLEVQGLRIVRQKRRPAHPSTGSKPNQRIARKTSLRVQRDEARRIWAHRLSACGAAGKITFVDVVMCLRAGPVVSSKRFLPRSSPENQSPRFPK